MNLLDEDKIIDLSELFKIFGDSTRVKIINVLLNNELCVCDLCELQDSKLVKYRKDKNLTYYFLADDHVEKIFKMGCEHINEI